MLLYFQNVDSLDYKVKRQQALQLISKLILVIKQQCLKLFTEHFPILKFTVAIHHYDICFNRETYTKHFDCFR